jgi:hypothetical protein
MHSLLLATSLLAPLNATQADPPDPAPAAAEDEAVPVKVARFFLDRTGDRPSRVERLLVAGGASGLSAVGLGIGVGFGIWSYMDFQCLSDVPACNKTRKKSEQITGTNFLTRRAEGERKAIVADMGYLVAATFAAVAGLALVASLWPDTWWPFNAEEPPDIPGPVELLANLTRKPQVKQDIKVEVVAPPVDAVPAPEPAAAPEAPPAPVPAPEPTPPQPDLPETDTPAQGGTP